MESISPKYMMSLIKKVKSELEQQFTFTDIRAYLERWIVEYDSFNQNFGICMHDNGVMDLDKTLQSIDDETLLRIAIDLEIETPDFIPSIPVFKNEVKSSYKTAGKTFELACKKVDSEPDTSISLANAALESIIKEILKDERIKDAFYNDSDTLYKLTEKCLKCINLYPSNIVPKEIRQMGSSLLSCCQAIEEIRSDKTLVGHGKTDDDFVIDDPTSALFVVNAVTTIGLFLLKQYQKYYPIDDLNSEIELPF